MESLLFQPHPHTKKSCKVLEGQEFRANEWIPKNSCLQQFTQPSPPLLPLGPSEVKWFVPKCVCSSFMKRTLVVRFLQGATSSKQTLNLIIWWFSYVKFNCRKSHLISHIKNMAQLVFSIFLPIFHAT